MEKQIVVEPISTEIAVKAQEEAPVMLKKAEAIVIFNQDQYEGANSVLNAVKSKIKEFETQRKGMTKPLDHVKTAIMDLFRTPLEILVKAKEIIDNVMITYLEEQDRLRREEQKKLDAKAKIDEEKKKKELITRSKKWAGKGNEAKAEELQEQAEDVRVDAPVVALKVEKVAGLSYQKIWKFRITDINKIPREYMIPDEIKLRRMAGAMKGIISVAGVEFYSEKILRSRNNA